MKTNEKLTGRFYFKKTWFGLILMVEINYNGFVNNGGYVTIDNLTEYRKCKKSDLHSLGLTSQVKEVVCEKKTTVYFQNEIY